MSAFGGSNIVTNGLVLCLDAANIKSYPGSGTTWTDLSGLGNNGAIQSYVTYNASGWFNFNVTDDTHINLGNPVSLQLSSAITIETWINPTTYNQGNMVNKNYNAGYRYRITDARGLEFIVGGQDNIIESAGGLVQNNAWSHCVVTGNILGLRAYVNGELVASNSNAYSPPLAEGGDFEIGAARNYSEYFDGKIAVCKIYNRALTAAEITQSYNALKGRFGL